MAWHASRTPASGIPAGGPGQGPASGLPASGIPASGQPASAALPYAPRHGARSPRVYGALATALATGLLADRADLAAYPEAVAAWATAESQAALLRRHLEDVGPIDLSDPAKTAGEPRSGLLTLWRSVESAAAKHRSTLGLDPHSEASLARERATAATLAVDLTALAERGRAVLAAREQTGLPGSLHDDLAGRVLAEQREQAAAEQAAHAAASTRGQRKRERRERREQHRRQAETAAAATPAPPAAQPGS